MITKAHRGVLLRDFFARAFDAFPAFAARSPTVKGAVSEASMRSGFNPMMPGFPPCQLKK